MNNANQLLVNALFIRKHYIDCPECDAPMSDCDSHEERCSYFIVECFADGNAEIEDGEG